MPALLSLLLFSWLSFAALGQSIVTIVFGAALSFYAARYLRRWDARKKEQDDEKAARTTRNKAAEAAQQKAHEAHALVQELKEKLQVVELEMAKNEVRNEATKEALTRIGGQLTQLIDTFLHRAA